MITVIYSLCLFVCVVMLLNMAQKNYNNIDIYHWTILILIPIIVMAYLLKTTVTTSDAAYVLMCFQYLDSAFLSVVVIFYLLHTAGVTARPWMKIALYGLGIVHMVIVCVCIHTDLYYSKVEVIESSHGNIVHVTGGPLMLYHYIYLGIIAVCLAAVVVIGIRNKGRYAFSTMLIYLSIPLVTFVLYFVEGLAGADYTMLPVAYAGIDVIIALNYEIAHTHDIAFLIADHHSSDPSRAYAAIGMNGKFLSCNEKSYEFLPFLRDIKVNDKLPKGDHIAAIIMDLIDSFERDGLRSVRYRLGELTCECEISYFSLHEGGVRHGYLLDIHDATEEQEAYDLIQSYNDRLNEEVREKTENIRDMQRKIVLGMAGIIENRDNNTGGHVKRTSDIIKIIVDEIMARGSMDISEQMAEDIVWPRRVIDEVAGAPVPDYSPVEKKVPCDAKNLLDVLAENYRVNQGLDMTIADIAAYVDGSDEDILKTIDELVAAGDAVAHVNKKTGVADMARASYAGLSKAHPNEYYQYWQPFIDADPRRH